MFKVISTSDDKVMLQTGKKYYKIKINEGKTQICARKSYVSHALHSVIFQQSSIPNRKSFILEMTAVIFQTSGKCCKNDDQGKITQRRQKVELWFLSTALHTIATNTHIKFQVYQT